MQAYLDHAATSPLRPEALAAMRPWLDPDRTTNPNGVHRSARAARAALEDARDTIAATLHVDPHAVVFTSGGTEAISAAVYAVLSEAPPGVVLRSAIEHDAVRASIDQWAAHFGHEVQSLAVTADGVTLLDRVVGSAAAAPSGASRAAGAGPVGAGPWGAGPVGAGPGGAGPVGAGPGGAGPVGAGPGGVGPVGAGPGGAGPVGAGPVGAGAVGAGLAGAGAEGVRLLAVMAANNEIGTVQPVVGLANGAPVLCDAICAAPWIDPATIGSLGDLVALSGHKIGGPAGIGVLIAPGARRPALLRGGAQEQDRRSGTQNVPGAVGLAAAVRALADDWAAGVPGRIASMRDRLLDGLLQQIDGATETGAGALKVAGNVHLCVEGIVSEELLVLLDRAGVAASAGSACSSGAMHASHVLLALGLSKERALGSLRLTLGRTTTDAEIDHALDVIPAAVAQLRR